LTRPVGLEIREMGRRKGGWKFKKDGFFFGRLKRAFTSRYHNGVMEPTEQVHVHLKGCWRVAGEIAWGKTPGTKNYEIVRVMEDEKRKVLDHIFGTEGGSAVLNALDRGHVPDESIKVQLSLLKVSAGHSANVKFERECVEEWRYACKTVPGLMDPELAQRQTCMSIKEYNATVALHQKTKSAIALPSMHNGYNDILPEKPSIAILTGIRILPGDFFDNKVLCTPK